MKRISTPTAVNNMFVDGNRTLGRKATQFSSEWCNQVQEELCNAIESITGSPVTGMSDHELADALKGDRVFVSVTIGANGGLLRVVQGTGPTISNFAVISAGIIEALQKFVVGNSKWEHGTHGDSITNLVGMESATVSADKLAEKTSGGNIQVLNKLVGDSDDTDPKVQMGAVAADSLEVSGGASVGGDMSVTGDVSAEDMIATGKVTADGGVETSNGDIKSVNGEVSGNTVKATGKLTLGDALRFVIDETSGHTASDAETWLASTAPANSVLCVINENTSGVVLWSGTTKQTSIIGKCALLVMKFGNNVYPVIASPNY
ncbi:hypothetical protein [Fibrobacter sp.]|uniref:hypothetical protein n=1 Tax=Fibrobacter sp. TaxID=35828 RepID=UPI0038674181